MVAIRDFANTLALGEVALMSRAILRLDVALMSKAVLLDKVQ